MLNCYVIDDEEHASKIIASYIEMTEGLQLMGTETNPLNALKKITGGLLAPDITFLDVDMPKVSGIELAGMIGNRTKVIFTTAFPEYAVNAFEHDAVDYITKPVSYIRFLKAVNKVWTTQAQLEPSKEEPEDTYFFVKTSPNGKLVKIHVNEIIYAEAKHNYVELVFKDKAYLAYLMLIEIEEQLPPDRFIRVQRSFIVNIELVKSIEGNFVTMVNGQDITIGASYRKMFQELVSAKSLKTKRRLP